MNIPKDNHRTVEEPRLTGREQEHTPLDREPPMDDGDIAKVSTALAGIVTGCYVIFQVIKKARRRHA